MNYPKNWASLEAQIVKNQPALQETWVQSLIWEDPLEEGMTTHSSILAWRTSIERGALWATYSPWHCKESDTTERLSTHIQITVYSSCSVLNILWLYLYLFLFSLIL